MAFSRVENGWGTVLNTETGHRTWTLLCANCNTFWYTFGKIRLSV